MSAAMLAYSLLYLALNNRSCISAQQNDDTTMTQASAKKNFSIATSLLGFVFAGQMLFAPLTLIGVAGLVYLVYPTRNTPIMI